ncbi:hypothetical protein FVF58_23845 [Paraburkholderia panacisoli]|uniref:Uncharacterized protein n=1 Tax=Paraburkholderia panacisoli TaxID=2603818 RepID=A0A5B0GXT9_9BURK|nr:hypothetical protein [Paraburkholderia panacisoli]KAA1007748.1 hypothetical protein FVF58_23845 [Paraburkholderia panacisoli]
MGIQIHGDAPPVVRNDVVDCMALAARTLRVRKLVSVCSEATAASSAVLRNWSAKSFWLIYYSSEATRVKAEFWTEVDARNL